MLRFLSGKVISVSDTLVVLDVNGMGFELLCTGRGAEMCREGENALLVTHLQISEAGSSLFGFADDRERGLFLKLTTVKGVGGKMAMNILKSAPAERVVSWIAASDVDSLVKIPGVGKKTAERLCFEMHRHFEGLGTDLNLSPEAFASGETNINLAMEGLRSLGFAQAELLPVFRKLKAGNVSADGDLSPEQWIRLALKELKRN